MRDRGDPGTPSSPASPLRQCGLLSTAPSAVELPIDARAVSSQSFSPLPASPFSSRAASASRSSANFLRAVSASSSNSASATRRACAALARISATRSLLMRAPFRIVHRNSDRRPAMLCRQEFHGHGGRASGFEPMPLPDVGIGSGPGAFSDAVTPLRRHLMGGAAPARAIQGPGDVVCDPWPDRPWPDRAERKFHSV